MAHSSMATSASSIRLSGGAASAPPCSPGTRPGCERSRRSTTLAEKVFEVWANDRNESKTALIKSGRLRALHVRRRDGACVSRRPPRSRASGRRRDPTRSRRGPSRDLGGGRRGLPRSLGLRRVDGGGLRALPRVPLQRHRRSGRWPGTRKAWPGRSGRTSTPPRTPSSGVCADGRRTSRPPAAGVDAASRRRSSSSRSASSRHAA